MPVTSPIAWATVRAAIYTFVNGATGWTVIWANQDAPQPAYPYITLNVVSGPTKLSEQDEHQADFDEEEDAGSEIGHSTGGMREMVVSIQAFQRQSSMTATTSPLDILTRAQSGLGMVTYRSALRTAGLTVVEVGPVQNVSTKVDDSWSARASMEVRFRLSASVTERTGYITSVVVDPTYETPGGGSVDPSLHAPFTVD